eukprot:m.214045 g.214045  ORF g.214045 m.214045 type:complete len:90 (+) comp10143_c3_seq2:2288-2557(+)
MSSLRALLFFALAFAIALQAAAVLCPDGSECPTDNTCCPAGGGSYGCCPYAKAVCCSGGLCCPSGTTCNKTECDDPFLNKKDTSPLFMP